MTDHVLDFCHGYLLMKLFSHLHQVLLWNVTLIILIDVLKDSLNVLNRVVLAWLLSHQLHKLFETNLSPSVSIENWHCNIDESSSWFVSSVLSDGLSKIKRSEHTVVVVIEEIEDLLEDLDISNRALCHDILFGIEVDIFFGLFEAEPWSFLGCVFLELLDSKWSSSSAKLIISADTHFF